MMTDRELQRRVLDELAREPEVDASKIGVVADQGVITLTGNAGTLSAKLRAESAARRVAGVEAVANELGIRSCDEYAPDDAAIAQRALSALEWNVSVPRESVKVTVSDGWLRLDGQVEWYYQKRAAEDAVKELFAVRGITNSIVVRPRVRPAEIKERVEAALRTDAVLSVRGISVEASDDKIVLTGNVRSLPEHENAIRAARSAPGVRRIIDHIAIRS